MSHHWNVKDQRNLLITFLVNKTNALNLNLSLNFEAIKLLIW